VQHKIANALKIDVVFLFSSFNMEEFFMCKDLQKASIWTSFVRTKAMH